MTSTSCLGSKRALSSGLLSPSLKTLMLLGSRAATSAAVIWGLRVTLMMLGTRAATSATVIRGLRVTVSPPMLASSGGICEEDGATGDRILLDEAPLLSPPTFVICGDCLGQSLRVMLDESFEVLNPGAAPVDPVEIAGRDTCPPPVWPDPVDIDNTSPCLETVCEERPGEDMMTCVDLTFEVLLLFGVSAADIVTPP